MGTVAAWHLFWRKHNSNPEFTEKDWQAYDEARKRSIQTKVNSAVSRFAFNLKLSKKKR